MSKKQPITIHLKEDITVLPGDAFRSKVVKSGSGAVINAYKKHIGKKAVVIIEEDGSLNGYSKEDLDKMKDWD